MTDPSGSPLAPRVMARPYGPTQTLLSLICTTVDTRAETLKAAEADAVRLVEWSCVEHEAKTLKRLASPDQHERRRRPLRRPIKCPPCGDYMYTHARRIYWIAKLRLEQATSSRTSEHPDTIAELEDEVERRRTLLRELATRQRCPASSRSDAYAQFRRVWQSNCPRSIDME